MIAPLSALINGNPRPRMSGRRPCGYNPPAPDLVHHRLGPASTIAFKLAIWPSVGFGARPGLGRSYKSGAEWSSYPGFWDHNAKKVLTIAQKPNASLPSAFGTAQKAEALLWQRSVL